MEVVPMAEGDDLTIVIVDGVKLEDKFIPLVNDAQEHRVEVQIPCSGIMLRDVFLPHAGQS